ncbi:MAG: type I restriction endonuclease subunit R [Candidatus Paceibacterota bacterium]|jgi:type I restriction enzyme R subunit
MKFNEQYTVENYIIKFLKETLGFEYIKPEIFEKFRSYENEYIAEPLLQDAIRKINGKVESGEMRNIIQIIRGVETNKEFLNLLRNGIDLIDSETRRTKNYQIVDFDIVDNNHFVVTNQFYFAGNAENIRPDIILFLNGIPIVDIEAKSPTASEQVDYAIAIGQIKRYERNAKSLFIPNCFNIATDGLKTVYGATYSGEQFFSEWKDKDLEEQYGGKLESTLVALLAGRNLLDIIQNFMVFEDTDEGSIKKIARYQQLRATNKIYERVKEGKQKRGLVWHTQGSGKSLTMFFTAWKLRYEKLLENPKIFVLVDRVDLDDQIFETFINCGGENVERVTSREELLKVIESKEAGIFVSTVHKFDENVKDIKNEASNIIVLIDEAHRTQYGSLGIYLRSSLPNASMIGFTGTPISKTHEEFGLLTSGNPERYLDYYSIKQAIEDNATVPVVYEARLSKFSIDEKEIDAQFDLATSDLSIEQKDLLSKKYGRKEAFTKLDKRMEAIARDIYEHFNTYVAPAGFKAQVVCYDRETTAKYKEIFDQIMPKEYSEVIYSPGEVNTDSPELSKYNKTKSEIKEAIKKFKDKNHQLKFLLVCDMLLTGFDAPVEQAMYLDKPLQHHNLLQAIARTNRTYPQKANGLIIDYYGITKNLKDALDFDESEIADSMIDMDTIKKDFESSFEKVSKIFHGINTEDPRMENLRKCFDIFRDNTQKQEDFKEEWNKLKIFYEIISPDPYLLPFTRQVEWFACFYIAFKKEFEADTRDVHALLFEYGSKLKAIIQSEVDFEGITKNYTPIRLDQFTELEKYKDPDEDKVRMLERALNYEISINFDASPVFKKFSERLTHIKTEFEKRQVALQETLKKLHDLADDIKKVDDEAKDLGLDMKQFALYSLSKEEGYIKEAEKGVLKQFSIDLGEYLDDLLPEGWQDTLRREDFLKDIKRQIQQMLLQEYRDNLVVRDFQKYLNRLVDVILKKF